MLELAHGRSVGMGIEMKYVLGPILDPDKPLTLQNRIPFPDESADMIISHGSMHHWGGGVENPKASMIMLNELHRMLKPGGRMLVYDINPDAILTRLITTFHLMGFVGGNYQDKAFSHSVNHSFDINKVAMVVKDCGFNNYKIYRAKPLFPVGLVFFVLEIRK